MTAFKLSKKWLLHIISVAVIIIYVAFVQYYYGWRVIIAAWKDIPLTTLLMALAIIFMTYVIRSLRIYDLVMKLSPQSFLPCLKITLIHNLLNNLLPMRTGELSFPLLMKKEFSVPLASSTATLILFRLLDFQVVVVIALLALTLIHQQWYWLPSVVFIMLCPLIVFPFRVFAKGRLSVVKTFGLGEKVGMLLDAVPEDFYALARMCGYTWLCWLVKIIAYAAVMFWFVQVDVWQLMVAACAGELSSILPIHTPAGLGTYEAGMVAGSGLLGVRGDWLLLAGVQLHMLIILSTLLSGVLAYLLPSRKDTPLEKVLV